MEPRRIKPPMRRTAFIARMAKLCGITQEESKKVVEYFNRTIVDCLLSGESVRLEGHYVFGIREHGERRRRNPKTGEFFMHPPSHTPYFYYAEPLKKKVKESLDK